MVFGVLVHVALVALLISVSFKPEGQITESWDAMNIVEWCTLCISNLRIFPTQFTYLKLGSDTRYDAIILSRY